MSTYPVQISSLIYLTFAKKNRITFFDPLDWAGWAKQIVADPHCVKFCMSYVVDTRSVFPLK